MMETNNLGFLVVEDDDFQRQTLIGMLSSLGAARILEATNGRQALDMLCSQRSKEVDIVLCDLNMPGMDGMEFLRHLSKVRSDVSIIVITSAIKYLNLKQHTLPLDV